MRTMSLSFSATLFPQNLAEDVNQRIFASFRCVSMSSSSSRRVIKSQHWPNSRRGFNTSNRVLSYSWMVKEGKNAQSAAVLTSVPVRVANELLQAGYHFLDVRTPEEFSDGHVVGAVNVPFMLRLGPGMIRNPKFLEQVLSHFRKDDEIIVGCQLGKRSSMAAFELVSSGFTGITDMAGGYAAWQQNGLPTE